MGRDGPEHKNAKRLPQKGFVDYLNALTHHYAWRPHGAHTISPRCDRSGGA
jgi:hypothetical protein